MRALAGRIPRAFKNHQTPEGALYRELIRAKLARLDTLPADARFVLREWGKVGVELQLLGQRLDVCRAMKFPRRAEVKRLQSESRKLRVQLLMLERRLDELAAANPSHPDVARQIQLAQRSPQPA